MGFGLLRFGVGVVVGEAFGLMRFGFGFRWLGWWCVIGVWKEGKGVLS